MVSVTISIIYVKSVPETVVMDTGVTVIDAELDLASALLRPAWTEFSANEKYGGEALGLRRKYFAGKCSRHRWIFGHEGQRDCRRRFNLDHLGVSFRPATTIGS